MRPPVRAAESAVSPVSPRARYRASSRGGIIPPRMASVAAENRSDTRARSRTAVSTSCRLLRSTHIAASKHRDTQTISATLMEGYLRAAVTSAVSPWRSGQHRMSTTGRCATQSRCGKTRARPLAPRWAPSRTCFPLRRISSKSCCQLATGDLFGDRTRREDRISIDASASRSRHQSSDERA